MVGGARSARTVEVAAVLSNGEVAWLWTTTIPMMQTPKRSLYGGLGHASGFSGNDGFQSGL